MGTQLPGTSRWHPRLIEAAAALNENQIDVAERLLKPHLKEDPFDVRAIRMLAELAVNDAAAFAALVEISRANVPAQNPADLINATV